MHATPGQVTDLLAAGTPACSRSREAPAVYLIVLEDGLPRLDELRSIPAGSWNAASPAVVLSGLAEGLAAAGTARQLADRAAPDYLPVDGWLLGTAFRHRAWVSGPGCGRHPGIVTHAVLLDGTVCWTGQPHGSPRPLVSARRPGPGEGGIPAALARVNAAVSGR